MNTIGGLSDSLLSGSESPARCSSCHASTRLGNGLCLTCVLQEALLADREASDETFESILKLAPAEPNEWRLGNYEILEEIGRGGMGVIYRARQRHSRRIVAVKRVLNYHADSADTLERFRREAEAAASLDHPNILPIYEVSQADNGIPFFSMKYSAGGSLAQNGKALAGRAREIVSLMAKVARAVEHAHSKGILHRDIKPGNILLDSRGEPLVSDFGLAKWLDAETDITRTLTIFGTPGYIAPEQLNGIRNLTPAADVYSIGSVLFDLLAGRPPFLGSHALSVIRQASERPAPKLRAFCKVADRDLETICAKCLEREPSARYQSAATLADDLERWLQRRPILARRMLPSTHAWRWFRRNPQLVATAAVCLALGAAAIWFLRGPAEKAATNLPPEKSVAVLPFRSLNNDQDTGLLASGMQDDVLNNLAKIADLKVIGANSVREYKASAPRNLRQIAQTLGVRNIVEGSVQRTGTRIRVNARLIDTTAGKQLWTQHYDREPENIFAIESELAKSIAGQLQVNLSPLEKSVIEQQQQTTDLQAYKLYVQGRELVRVFDGLQDPEQSLDKAIGLLEQATQRDPNFALAYCQIAIAHTFRFFAYAGGAAAANAAKQAVDNALRLAPDLGETHLAISRYYTVCLQDYDAARRELVIARRTLPNDADAVLYSALSDRHLGRWDDAVAGLRKLAALAPRDITAIDTIADTNIALRRYREAEDFLKETMARVPEYASHCSVTLADCYLAEGDLDAAKSTLAKLPGDRDLNDGKRMSRYILAMYRRDFVEARNALAGAPASRSWVNGLPIPLRYDEGVIARAQQDDETARAAFADARREVIDRWGDDQTNLGEQGLLGAIDAALGQKEEAIRRGRHALELAKDSFDRAVLATNLVDIYACTGERELALQQLEQVAKLPYGPSYANVKYGFFCLCFWDDLRGDPRYEALVASLAPALR